MVTPPLRAAVANINKQFSCHNFCGACSAKEEGRKRKLCSKRNFRNWFRIVPKTRVFSLFAQIYWQDCSIALKNPVEQECTGRRCIFGLFLGAAGVLLVFCRDFAGFLPGFCRSFAEVLPKFCRSFADILRLISF